MKWSQSRIFMDGSLPSLSVTPLDSTHGYWPLYNSYHWYWKFRKVSKFRSCFFLHGIKPWILSWLSIWWRRPCRKPLIKKCPPCQVQGLLRRSYEFKDRSKSAGAPGSHPQSQVHGLGVCGESSMTRIPDLRVLFEHAGEHRGAR